MGSAPCDELEVELALDRLDGELAVELPAHVRAFARAHADGAPPPPAPLVARLASTRETARRAGMHEVLADRGLALLRLVAPIAIESDPAVVAARAEPRSWPGLQRLAAARDAAALAMFGERAVAFAHRLHGVGTRLEAAGEVPARIDGWHARDVSLSHADLDAAWETIANRFGVSGAIRIERSATAHPRTFVVAPGREVIVVVPAVIETPAARFAVLHELGHAVIALAQAAPVPRVIDEAVAAYVARFAEPPSWLPPPWPSELAVAARARRLALAKLLDALECALPALGVPPSTSPPWALWHDPGAQAAYVAAEALADRMRDELGAQPHRGPLVATLRALGAAS